MNFALSNDLLALQARVRHFIAEQVIPYERDARQTPHGPSAELRSELIAKARAAGLLTPHASVELGGLGLSHLAKAVVECAGVGVCTSDFGQHDFKHLLRPIYPLDADVTR